MEQMRGSSVRTDRTHSEQTPSKQKVTSSRQPQSRSTRDEEDHAWSHAGLGSISFGSVRSGCRGCELVAPLALFCQLRRDRLASSLDRGLPDLPGSLRHRCCSPDDDGTFHDHRLGCGSG